MSSTKLVEMKSIVLTIVLIISVVANADDASFYDRRGLIDDSSLYDRRGLIEASAGGSPTVFDVSKCDGAKGDGTSDMTTQVQKAWNDTCHSNSSAKLLIPKGDWLTGELCFSGPCTAPQPITIELQGTLKAKADCGSFPKGTWINIYGVGVQIMGGGTICGEGQEAWKTRKLGEAGKPLPDSLVFGQTNNSGIENIQILNSKGFNMKIVDVCNFTANLLTITAPGDSPNTDGIHIGRVSNISITNTVIGVGDDCISIGDGSSDIKVTNITCGPGHGISIGSLGRYPDEKDVKNVQISNCTLVNTTNGARIKTFRESSPLQATNISFTDITVKDVYNPIIIDQHYASAQKKGGSKVKISGITFKNIKGTSFSNVAVSLNCSDCTPCEGIDLTDIDFTYSGTNTMNTTLSTACANAKATFNGKINPAGC